MDIDIVRQEIGDEEIGRYLLSITGTVDESSLRSSFSFVLYRRGEPAGEHRLDAIYDFERRDRPRRSTH